MKHANKSSYERHHEYGTAGNKGVALTLQTTNEENVREFDIEYSLNGNSFSPAGTILPHNTASVSSCKFFHGCTYNGSIFYRLKIIDIDGSVRYSNVISVRLNNATKNMISLSVINSGTINVNRVNGTYLSIELIGMNGNRLLQKNTAGQTGNLKIPVNKLATGVYLVRLRGNSTSAVQKIFIQ
jgi:hypothetical protein